MIKHLAVLVAVVLWACEKAERETIHHPEMHYTELNDREVTYTSATSIDVNEDDVNDFTFHTLLVGDPLLKRDRLLFYAASKENTYLLSDAQDRTLRLDKLDLVELNHPGYTWYDISALVLAEKIIPESGGYLVGWGLEKRLSPLSAHTGTKRRSAVPGLGGAFL